MDDESFWDLAFATVVSIRFHPKNDGAHHPKSEVEFSADVADIMLEIRNARRMGRSGSGSD